MKIVYLTHQYFPYFYTGTELLTDNLSRYLRKLGLSTEVWAYNLESKNETSIKKTNYLGIPVTFFSHHNQDSKRDISMFRSNSGKSNFIKEVIKKEKPDLIHVTHSSRMGDVVDIASQLGIPYVVTITDYWLICPTATLIKPNGDLCQGTIADPDCLKYCYKNDKKELTIRWKTVKGFLANASQVVYAADIVKGMFEKNGIDTKGWMKVKHGYNISGKRERIKDKFYRFAFTGTLQRSKGGHLAIEAFKKISDQSARLSIYGDTKHDTEYSDYCLNLAKEDKRIWFKGRYDHTKLTKEFADIDCIIVPSNWFEPFPFTLISAVSYGFEVIGSQIGGIPEIIGENNQDSLFESGNIADLQEKMVKKIEKGKISPSKVFYDQNIEGEGYKYSQIYNSLKKDG